MPPPYRSQIVEVSSGESESAHGAASVTCGVNHVPGQYQASAPGLWGGGGSRSTATATSNGSSAGYVRGTPRRIDRAESGQAVGSAGSSSQRYGFVVHGHEELES